MKKTALLIVALLLLIPLQSNVFAQVSSIKSGSIYRIVSKPTGKILDVSNSSLENSAKVGLWSDTQSDAQRWVVTSVGKKQYTLTNVASGKLLHIADATPAAGVGADQYDNTADNTVKWELVKQKNGSFNLQSAANNKFVLGVQKADTLDGSAVTLYPVDESDAQAWTFYLEAPQDAAPTPAIAEKIFDAWKSKYYDNNRRGNEVITREGFWGVAEVMEVVVDAFEVTGKAKYATMFDDMYKKFIAKEGEDWMKNDYNDDISWMVIACVRAGILTHNKVYVDKAKDQFDKMWARAYVPLFGGGLIWKQGSPSTNACINGPAMVACCYLAQATGDKTYNDKAIKMYDWSKLYLLNAATGKVNDNYNNGRTSTWSSTYNQGTYLGAAVMLYDLTKNPTYLEEADKIAQYTKVDMFKSKAINTESGRDLDGFKGIFMRYARRYVVDCNRADYIPWLHLSAKVAYNNRNSENLIGTLWGTRTVETKALTPDAGIRKLGAFAASTAVSLMINCPYTTSKK